MRVRSVATGEIIDIDDEGARILIEARIYEPAGDEPPVMTKMAKPITTRRPRP